MARARSSGSPTSGSRARPRSASHRASTPSSTGSRTNSTACRSWTGALASTRSGRTTQGGRRADRGIVSRRSLGLAPFGVPLRARGTRLLRPARFVSGSVDQLDDAFAESRQLDELQARLASFVEEALSATHDKRVDEQPEFVDQAGRQQRPYQAGTAVDHDVPPRLLFQLRDFGRKIALDQVRVVPREFPQGPRRDELRHAVELVREPVRVFPAGPSRREPLIRHTSQEERVRGAGLVELELLGLLAPKWEAPLLGRFDDAVHSSGVPLAGAAIFATPGCAARTAGPASIVSWMLLSLASYPFAYTFAKLSAKRPESGGIYAFARDGIGLSAGAATAWLFLAWAVLGAPAATVAAASYLAFVFPLTRLYIYLAAASILILAFVVNYVGIRFTGRVQLATVAAILVALVIAVVASAPRVRPANYTPFLPSGLGSIGTAAALIVWSYLGYENTSNVAEEFRNPERDFHRSVVISVFLIAASTLPLPSSRSAPAHTRPGAGPPPLPRRCRTPSVPTAGATSRPVRGFFPSAPAQRAWQGSAGAPSPPRPQARITPNSPPRVARTPGGP